MTKRMLPFPKTVLIANVKITTAQGIIKFTQFDKVPLEGAQVEIVSGYVNCVITGLLKPVYIWLSLGDNYIQHNSSTDYSFFFDPSAIINKTLTKKIYLGKMEERRLRVLRYKIYDDTFTLVTGTPLLLLQIRFKK